MELHNLPEEAVSKSIGIIPSLSSRKKRVMRCGTLMNPRFYRDAASGLYKPIQIEQTAPIVSKSGVAADLFSSNIRSLGFRKDGNPSKFLGLRPDEEQSGKIQLEFSNPKVTINGKEQPVSLDGRAVAKEGLIQKGDFFFKQSRQRMLMLWKGSRAIEKFRMELTIHATGLLMLHEAKVDRYSFYDNGGNFVFGLEKPRLVSKDGFNSLRETDGRNRFGEGWLRHSLTQNLDGSWLYVKESTELWDSKKLPSIFFIDANTCYSSTADGYISSYSGYKATTTLAWNAARGGTGTLTAYTADSDDTGIESLVDTGSLFAYVKRSFFYFDTSAVGEVVSSCTIYARVLRGANAMSIAFCPSAQDGTLSSNDWTAVTFSSVCEITPSTSYATRNANFSSFDSIVEGGTTLIAGVESYYDYGNTKPSSDYYASIYFTEGGYDPYLSIEWAPVAKPRIFFFN